MLFPKPSRQSKRAGDTDGPKLHGKPVRWSTLHLYVILRDGVCVGWAFAETLGELHECRDRFGFPHGPKDRSKLTLDHVADPNVKGLGMKREIAAPDDERHLVALCAKYNIGGPSQELRAFERAWIAEKEAAYDEAETSTRRVLSDRRGDG